MFHAQPLQASSRPGHGFPRDTSSAASSSDPSRASPRHRVDRADLGLERLDHRLGLALQLAGRAGPAAIISWVIGGVAILILALTQAELGGMYPVAGGTARFQHYAFGRAAGASFGWFTWLQR